MNALLYNSPDDRVRAVPEPPLKQADRRGAAADWTDAIKVHYLIYGRTEREANEEALKELASVSWAEPLLTKIAQNGGLKAPSGLLFELRFAAELNRVGSTATYEFKTGVGNSTVDFLVHSSPEWLVELASPEARKAGGGEESQMIKFAGVLSDKVCDAAGAPQKFPVPSTRFHMIVLDVRAYLIGMGDYRDWRQIVYGPAGLSEEDSWATHYVANEPIRGPLDLRSPVPSAQIFRDRIHFVGFIKEKAYFPGEIRTREVSSYLANPTLFSDGSEVRNAFLSYPLRPNL